MEEYRLIVSFLAKNKISKTFLNQDSKHANVVLPEMFKNAESSLRILAKNLCNDVTNSPEYISAISRFIEKGGELKILLTEFVPEEAMKSKLYTRLAFFLFDKKNIKIKRTPNRAYLGEGSDKKEIHFAIADKKAYRIETDIEERTAEVNYNNETLSELYANFFDEMFNGANAEDIDLLKLIKLTK
jgi:hypothetical protein